jgi:membrane fusion protein (multidrug efflux system)
VVFHGRVVGFGAGTGAAFALLPAQNATGNWIKIVQRVPVRIALDPKELAVHPLQIGLSMRAYVDIRHDGSPRLPEVADSGPDDSTSVFRTADAQAKQTVREIIAANDPGAAHPAGAGPQGARNALFSPAGTAGTVDRTLRVANRGAVAQTALPRVVADDHWMN